MVLDGVLSGWRKLNRALIILAVLLLLTWLAHVLKDLFFMLLIGGGLAFILEPAVARLSQYMRRGLAIVVTYLGLIAALSVGVGVLVPQIIVQVQHFQHNLPDYEEQFAKLTGQAHDWYDSLPDKAKLQVAAAQQNLEDDGKRVLQTILNSVLGIIGWIAKGLIMLVLSIYLLVDKELIIRNSIGVIPPRYRYEVTTLVSEILSVLRAYLRGQLVVIGFVAISVTVALLIGQVPYALTIGTLAGVLEVIPYFGAAAGAIPAVILGYMRHAPDGNGVAAAGLLILFFVCINQIEGHLVIPFVMGRTMEMRPLAVLLSLLVGADLAGVPGLIVAVPVARISQILVAYLVRAWRQVRDDEPLIREPSPPAEEKMAVERPVLVEDGPPPEPATAAPPAVTPEPVLLAAPPEPAVPAVATTLEPSDGA